MTDIATKFAAAERDWMLGQVASIEEAMGWTEAEVEAYRVNGTLPTDTGADIPAPEIAQAPVAVEDPTPPPKDTEPDTPALGGFLAGIGVELTPEQQALVDQMMAPELAQPAAAPPTLDISKNAPGWIEAVQSRPQLLTMAEAASLEVEDFTLIDASGPLPPISALEYVRAGDQLTIEWDGQGGLERYTGRVIQFGGSTEPGDDRPWVYLKGNGSHIRTPMEGVRIVAHLLYQDGGAFQTSQPETIRSKPDA